MGSGEQPRPLWGIGGWMVVATLLMALAMPAWTATSLEVSISGLSGETLENVKASLNLWQQRQDETLTAKKIQQLYGDAPAEIRRALEPFGYYQPTILHQLIKPEKSALPWRATLDIDVGQPVSIDVVDIRFRSERSGVPEMEELVGL